MPNLQSRRVKAAIPSHRGGVGFIPRAVHWDLRWTKWCRGRLSSFTSAFRSQFSYHQTMY